MDTMKTIERLVQIARQEDPPEMSVSGSVMAHIRTFRYSRPAIDVMPVSWVAGMSAVAASIVLFLAFYAFQSIHDPYMNFFAPIQVTWLW